MEIIVAVLGVLFLLHPRSFRSVLLTGLDVVVLDEAVVVFLWHSPGRSHYSHAAHHAAGERRPVLAVLADPVGLLQQRVSVAGQEAVEEAKLDRHDDDE